MKKDLNVNDARVYCGTYRKYNEGSIFGKWFELSEFYNKDDFYQACADLHNDEDDPEFMFKDWENIPDGLISECWLSDKIFEVIEKIKSLDDNYQNAFMAYIDYLSYNLNNEDIGSIYNDFEEAYQGEFDSDEDFAQNIAEELGYIDRKVTWPYTCIDWEWAARDLMYDYFENNGFYFRNL